MNGFMSLQFVTTIKFFGANNTFMDFLCLVFVFLVDLWAFQLCLYQFETTLNTSSYLLHVTLLLSSKTM